MGKKRKTRKQEEEKEEEDLLEYFSRLSYTVIYGRKFPRIKYEGTTNCEGCHTEPGHLHRVCCRLPNGKGGEICPFCFDTFIDCYCSPNVEDMEKDQVALPQIKDLTLESCAASYMAYLLPKQDYMLKRKTDRLEKVAASHLGNRRTSQRAIEELESVFDLW